jgi:hypothetical protein
MSNHATTDLLIEMLESFIESIKDLETDVAQDNINDDELASAITHNHEEDTDGYDNKEQPLVTNTLYNDSNLEQTVNQQISTSQTEFEGSATFSVNEAVNPTIDEVGQSEDILDGVLFNDDILSISDIELDDDTIDGAEDGAEQSEEPAITLVDQPQTDIADPSLVPPAEANRENIQAELDSLFFNPFDGGANNLTLAIDEEVNDEGFTTPNISVVNESNDDNDGVDITIAETTVNDPAMDAGITDLALQQPITEASIYDPALQQPIMDAGIADPALQEPTMDAGITDLALQDPIMDAGITDLALQEPIMDAGIADPALQDPIMDAGITDPALQDPIMDAGITDLALQEPAVNNDINLAQEVLDSAIFDNIEGLSEDGDVADTIIDKFRENADLITEGTEYRDLLRGSANNDFLRAYDSDDVVRGGDGDDVIIIDGNEATITTSTDINGQERRLTNGSNDYYYGGSGSDNFIITENTSGHHMINDFEVANDNIAVINEDGEFTPRIDIINAVIDNINGSLIDVNEGEATVFLTNANSADVSINSVSRNGDGDINITTIETIT